MSRLSQVIDIIRAHGREAEIRNGQVWGLMPWTNKDGESGETWERVRNVYQWLGY